MTNQTPQPEPPLEGGFFVRELDDWNTVGQSVLSPAISLLAGTVLIAFSVVIFIATRNAGGPDRWFAILIVFCFFGLAGLLFVAHALREIGAARRRASVQATHDAEMWLWDYRWDASGTLDRSRGDWKKILMIALLFALIMVPFHQVAVQEGSLNIWWVFVAIFDIAIVAVLAAALYHVIRRLKYGAVRVSFTRFPYFTGEQIDAVMHGGAWLRNASRVRARLRYVEEKIESRRTAKGTARVIVAYAKYEDEVEYLPEMLQQHDVQNLPIRFQLPANAPTTELHKSPPSYWDLEVSVETPGVDYNGHFLLPIYRRAG